MESDLQNKSVTPDPLLGDVQLDPIATPEQRQFNDTGQKIEQDGLVYSTFRSINVSSCKLAMVNFC